MKDLIAAAGLPEGVYTSARKPHR
jgi:hypothetical protein